MSHAHRRGQVSRRRRVAAALGATVLVAALAAPAAVAAPCARPAAGGAWGQPGTAALDLDGARLGAAVDRDVAGGQATVAVYRHGCLAATASSQPGGRDRAYESWSTAKTVVSLAAGRAMTLGLLSPDDRLGALVPEADKAHGGVTLRQLLQMSAGVHWNFSRDYNVSHTENRVDDFLTLAFDHPPGTYFEYSQSTVAIVAEMVARAAGQDFQAFVQRQLFGPIGIAPGSWSWLRDGAHHTLGFMGLQLRPADYARLGHLMLGQGVWSGRRLLAPEYVTAATTRSTPNPGYGWFWWVNGGSRFVGPTVQNRPVVRGPILGSAPKDMFSAVGLGDQIIMVVPSLDVVVTRSNGAGVANANGSTASLGSKDWELLRQVVLSDTAARHADPGPYPAPVAAEPPESDHGIAHSLTETDQLAAAKRTPVPPPRGPSVARQVLVGGETIHLRPVDVRVSREGTARLALACPKVGVGSCRGTVQLRAGGADAGAPVTFRIARGKHVAGRAALSEALRRRVAKGHRISATAHVVNTGANVAVATDVRLRLMR